MSEGKDEAVRIKICGVTNEEDLRTCVEAGVDFVGLNLWSGSKRYLPMEEGLALAEKFCGQIRLVAVTVDADEEMLGQITGSGLFHGVQLHGHETAEDCARLKLMKAPAELTWIKALRVKDAASVEKLEQWPVSHLLLDAYRAGEMGGTGATFDWSLARAAVENYPDRRIILSGGLTPENAGEAVRKVWPWAVDVASGVEDADSPRRKNAEKIQGFVSSVRRAETLSISGGKSGR